MTSPHPGDARLGALPTELTFRLLVESVKDYAIYMLDPEGHVTSWNAGAERIKGYRSEEILGQHFSRFYTPEDIHADKPARELRAAATGGRVEDEGWRVRRDGSRFWASVTIAPLRDEQGTLLGYVKITRDLTERRRAEQALRATEERFRLMVDSIKDYAILMLDPEGVVISWNTGAERLKGYRAEEILGQPFTRFYTPEDIAGGKPQRLLRTAAQVGYVEDEGWRVRQDGSRFWANAVLTAMRDPSGALVGFVKVTRDLSERRQAEEELARANTELESFSYSISHDLRAPLRAIDGFARALSEDYAASLDAEGQRLLGIVQDNARHMGRLIDALLSFSRLGRQSLRVKPVDMTGLAQSVLDDLPHAKDAPAPEVTLQPLPQAVGDETLLRQVFANLIGNALKFSRGKPQPRVEIGARVEGNEAVYVVKDNGVGFDMRYAAKLFQVFTRLHRSEQFEGTGVGLALTERIVQRHGGRIWAESEVDKGASFYFSLPRPAGR